MEVKVGETQGLLPFLFSLPRGSKDHQCFKQPLAVLCFESVPCMHVSGKSRRIKVRVGEAQVPAGHTFDYHAAR